MVVTTPECQIAVNFPVEKGTRGWLNPEDQVFIWVCPLCLLPGQSVWKTTLSGGTDLSHKGQRHYTTKGLKRKTKALKTNAKVWLYPQSKDWGFSPKGVFR